jgi:hypothetical protein
LVEVFGLKCILKLTNHSFMLIPNMTWRNYINKSMV